MNISLRLFRYLAPVCLCMLMLDARAQTEEPMAPANAQAQAPATPAAETPTEVAPEEAPADDDDDSDTDDDWTDYRSNAEIVSVGHDSILPKGETAREVVAVFGSVTAEGDVYGDVVSVLGDTIATGSVGGDAVAVLGTIHINNVVRGDVVAVLGNVELGPEADIRGAVVCIGGNVNRDPAAKVAGGVQRILANEIGTFTWLRPWVQHALLYGRPLAFADGLGWAWGVALGFLAFYALLAFLFRDGVNDCVRTLEEQPGKTILASILTLVLTPVAIVLLCITVIGIALVPFVGMALFAMGLFGKAVVLAAIGRRVTVNFPEPALQHPAIGVLIGGVFVLLLYVVPIVGFITYKVLGMLGMGMVVYTLILRSSRTRAAALAAGGTPEGVPALAAASAGSTAFAADPMSPQFSASSIGPSAEPSASGAVLSTTPVLASALPRAGFWIRMAALALDVLLIIVICWLLDDFAGRFWPVLLAAYGALMWKLKATTVGGIICGLRIVRLDNREIDWATAIVRALGCFLSMVVAGLGFIWIAFDPERQAWHDKIAGTVVVMAPKGASLV